MKNDTSKNKAKIKTINFRFLFWFGIVFVIGAVVVSLMSRSIICDDLQMAWPLYLGVALFGAVAVVGIIGVIVLLCTYLILKSVLKHGTETTGKFVCVGKIICWRTDRGRSGSGMKPKWFNQIIFSCTVDGEDREYKSCTVYLDNQVEKLDELKTFPVKYKGKHAVICEKV